MKTKIIVLTSLIASGLALAPSGFAAGGRAAPRAGRSPIVRTPNPGNPTAINKDGTYKVAYDDGDVSPSLTRSQIGHRVAVASSGSASSEGNCPGPGHTRRCNGVCTTISGNNDNCGGCGDACKPGYSCQGLFCRDASGNLGSTYRK